MFYYIFLLVALPTRVHWPYFMHTGSLEDDLLDFGWIQNLIAAAEWQVGHLFRYLTACCVPSISFSPNARCSVAAATQILEHRMIGLANRNLPLCPHCSIAKNETKKHYLFDLFKNLQGPRKNTSATCCSMFRNEVHLHWTARRRGERKALCCATSERWMEGKEGRGRREGRCKSN